MDRLYLDTNIILDFLQDRQNASDIVKIFLKAHKKEIQLITSVLNFATIFYFESRAGHSTAKIISRFKNLNRIINPVDQSVDSYNSALHSGFPDFEDALQHFAAIENNAHYLISRNKKDYKKSKIPVCTAKEYVLKFL